MKGQTSNFAQAPTLLKHLSRAKHCTIVFCITLSALTCSSFRPGETQAQTAKAPTPQFEVTSVKQNVSESTSSHIDTQLPDRFAATNVPLRFLILEAYELRDHELVGAPEWASDKSFDVIGTYPKAQRPPLHDIHLMLQHLLADRFGLKVHREQRELPAYDLVLARKDGRLGPQIHTSDMDCAAWIADGRPKTVAGRPSLVSPSGERPLCSILATRKWLTGGARTMQDLTGPMQAMLGRPVENRTGLTASYDIDLQWAAMDLHAEEAATATPSEGPSLFTALQEQLGLKLVSHKEKFDIYVIDGIKLPDPN